MAFGKSPVNLSDLTGQRFQLLTVTGRAGNTPTGQAVWACRCDCGQQITARGYKLRQGHTKSCGCLRLRGQPTHGKSRTPTYNSWCAMKQRCGYEKSDQFRRYGARGITVCDRWLHSFENFVADMGERPAGTTIDRIDSDGNYEPGNCRWALEATQARNRRSTINVTRDGVTKCIKDWCDVLGLPHDRVYGRIRRGATPEEALR